MTEEEKPLEPGFSKCDVCGEVKYLSGTPTCDSCRKKRETLGESGFEFCPLIKSACYASKCMWWVEAKGDDLGECAVQMIGYELKGIRTNGIDTTNHY